MLVFNQEGLSIGTGKGEQAFCFHACPGCALQKAKHVEGKSYFKSQAPCSNPFPLFAIGLLELHKILHFVTLEYVSLSAVPGTTNYPVPNGKIACSLKLLQDDKDGQDAETPAVTEHDSSFFHSVINRFRGIISQTIVTICIHPKTDDKSFSHKCLPETWLSIQKAGKRILFFNKHWLSYTWQCLTSYSIWAAKLLYLDLAIFSEENKKAEFLESCNYSWRIETWQETGCRQGLSEGYSLLPRAWVLLK